MRAIVVVVIAGCGRAPAPPAPAPAAPPATPADGPAWQAFARDPFPSVFSGHQRAFWATSVPEPPWIAQTFANLELAPADGTRLAGTVTMYAATGLDPTACAVEILWNAGHGQGARLGAPPALEAIAGIGVRADWHFAVPLADPPPIVEATAYVFCPIDAAHRTPPAGALFTSIAMVTPGPRARAALCTRRPRPTFAATTFSLAGHRTAQLAFACGVLPRVRGRDLVDDCHGDVLLGLDQLGAGATISAPPTGTAADDTELRAYLSSDDACAHLELTGFTASAQPAFDAAVKRLGPRLLSVSSRDGMIQP